MMNEAAVYAYNSCGPVFSGLVGGRTGSCFHVQTQAASLRAQKASSCLLVPETGDRVLVFSDPGDPDAHFILSVLTRNPEKSAENHLDFDGPTRFRVSEGNLRFQSEQDIQMAAAGRFDIASHEIHAHANKAETTIDQCTVFGRMLKVQVEVVKSAARLVDQLVKRFTLRADTSVRYIREHDETQAESARYLTEKTLTMHSKNAVHTGEELVSINGGQINLS
ncbi:MAG: DUF3540 domain-containing protein [Desulfosalsimonas sp.]